MRGRKSSFEWTDLEEDILIQAVKESKGNIKKGLENAADVLGTTFYICRNRWYKHTQHILLEREQAAAGEIETPVVRETEVVVRNETDSTVEGVKESLEDFLGHLSNLVTENKRLSERNKELEIDNKALVAENRELKEAYDYILKVIDRARRLCLEDEERPEKVKYTIKDGAVDFSA